MPYFIVVIKSIVDVNYKGKIFKSSRFCVLRETAALGERKTPAMYRHGNIFRQMLGEPINPHVPLIQVFCDALIHTFFKNTGSVNGSNQVDVVG